MINYYIICTEQPDNIIVRVGGTNDLRNAAAEFAKTREQVIQDLDDNKIIFTAHSWSKESGYKKGAKVKKIWVGDKPYISTKWNNIKRDNLDSIRECNFK